MATEECSGGGELLATEQVSSSSPNHHHTYPTHIHTNKLCLPLIALIRLPNKRHYVLQVSYVCWHLSEHRLQDIDPEGLSDILQPNCALFCNFHLTLWFSLDISSPSS